MMNQEHTYKKEKNQKCLEGVWLEELGGKSQQQWLGGEKLASLTSGKKKKFKKFNK